MKGVRGKRRSERLHVHEKRTEVSSNVVTSFRDSNMFVLSDSPRESKIMPMIDVDASNERDSLEARRDTSHGRDDLHIPSIARSQSCHGLVGVGLDRCLTDAVSGSCSHTQGSPLAVNVCMSAVRVSVDGHLGKAQSHFVSDSSSYD